MSRPYRRGRVNVERFGRLRRPLPMLIALVATLCAAALVLYYQYRALAALQSQTQVIFRQLGEQTATTSPRRSAGRSTAR